ncbi:MAG: PAS domain-containing protein [Oscillospiraceae bacterium]|nr:PAS domain-containing protein [Oscillospiraceae bacterium]
MDREQQIQNRIISDLSEGVMVIRFDGVVEYVNDAALTILHKKPEDLIGLSFARAFFTDVNNDTFIQCALDVIYRKARRHECYVPYNTGETTRQLRIVSSYLTDGDTATGIIFVISDITELEELRDAVKAMETIRGLNQQLEMRNQLLQETFGRYLSDDIVREILEAPDGWKLGGQKRKLTVLMSDLRGFTAMSERMRPKDLIDMLNHYFGEMYEEIMRYHGTLIEFLGDGMMVIFGAPAATDTHAADAVAAAVGMQKRMPALNLWNVEHGYEPLGMGIGINTGSVILGNIGSERRTKYGVLGAVVNLAGRIESYTTAGQILISPDTRKAIREKLEIGETIHVSPKGVTGKIALSEVIGIGDPYGVRLEESFSCELQTLETPVPVSYMVLEDKAVDDEEQNAVILALSEAEAVLETDVPLVPYQNLCLEIGGSLYVKVKETDGTRSRIYFTAKPPCFKAWMEQAVAVASVVQEGSET